MNFRKVNNITGWLVFAIAYITYLLTMEATASLWDCGEFLSTAYRLEVGHSPGAPLFMMLGRLFAIFAPGPEKVAVFVNSMSALMSAFTILFLFWTITHFARKLVSKQDSDLNQANLIAIMGAGAVGALAYTFSDTFWFSAVEAEVLLLPSLRLSFSGRY
jgi:amino acid permease